MAGGHRPFVIRSTMSRINCTPAWTTSTVKSATPLIPATVDVTKYWMAPTVACTPNSMNSP